MKFIILVIILFAETISAQQKGVSKLEASAHSSTSKTFAVVIGISDYQDPGIPDLRFADKDAEAFANYLRSIAGGQLDKDHLKVLINQQATLGQFANALDWLIENAKEGDEAIIYFSGHGDVEKKTITQPGFLLCWDSPARVYMSGGAFNLRDVQEIVSTLSIQNKAKVIVITDACRSGTLAGSSVGGSQATASNLAKQYANEIKIMSCQPNEFSIEGEQWGGGRGAFSYHLIDALYGMADSNDDQWVTLQEVGRYLEDHVSNEVAPVSQVPMIIGNRNERLTSVDANLLASIKSGKTNQMMMLTTIESKGIEEDVLSKVDTTIKERYHLFTKSIQNKRLLEPKDACADSYYEQLIKEPKLERLFSTMKRNYAAALQDDAQQAMNIWLKADVKQIQCIGKTLRLEPIPRLLDRAAKLLGEKHYMYRSLLSRKLLFEGISLGTTNESPDSLFGRKLLAIYQKAIELESQSPIIWQKMSLVYLLNLRMTDSAFICAKEANKFAPNWVVPYAELGYYLFNTLFNNDLAKEALQEAEIIDSLHPYVINRWAAWYSYQNGNSNQEKSLALYEKYKSTGGPMYPCWYNDYSIVLQHLGKYKEAELELFKALEMDSINFGIWDGLGVLYMNTGRNNEAIVALKKSIYFDSLSFQPYYNLGIIYENTGNYTQAEYNYKKSISLDSTFSGIWSNLGNLFITMKRYNEAEPALLKAISLDSLNFIALVNLGSLYRDTKRFALAEQTYKKAISVDSTFLKAWSNLGYLYRMMERYDLTLSVYKKELTIDSTNSDVWNDLGKSFLTMERYIDAKDALNRAISLDSMSAYPHKHLATVYLRTNRLIEARIHYLKAIELDPKYSGGYLGLAFILTAEGKIDEAFAQLEKAIQIKDYYVSYEVLSKTVDLEPLMKLSQWKDLMKKYFPDK